MPESVSKTSSKDKRTNEGEGHVAETARLMTSAGPPYGILALQRALGNQGVNQLLKSNMEAPTSATGHNSNAEQSELAPSKKFLIQANSEPGKGLEESVRTSIERATGESLSEVRVHNGSASAAAAEGLGARAYTIGSDIHLGSEARRLNLLQRNRLLAHEAVHTIQQGGQPAALQGKLEVSHPGDTAELEADHIAESVMAATQTTSPALAMRNQFRVTPLARHTVSRVAAPLIQRDLTGDHPVKEGKFTLDLKKASAGTQVGLKGTIKFKASDKAPDSTSIRLLQVVRTENLTTGKEEVWSGGEANRHKVMTVADPSAGVQGGYFVDHAAASASPRSKKTDAPVSPYYRDYWPNASMSQDGSKKGKTVQVASLADWPKSSNNVRFSFETLAKDTKANHVYGTVMWGFTITDASKGKIEKERAVGRNVTLLTTDKAIEKFDEFYRNAGASTAPK